MQLSKHNEGKRMTCKAPIFIRRGSVVTYDWWTTERSTLGIIDDMGNCVPLGDQAYDFMFLGSY